MNSLEHTKAAEAILDDFNKEGGDYYDDDELDAVNDLALRIGELHAQLAVAGAVAALTRTLQRVFENDPAKGAEVARRRAEVAP